MRTAQVTVRFPHGLHARPAVSLVRQFKGFHSRVLLRLGKRVANVSSIISILLLCATFNSQLEVQAAGEDEDAAIRAAVDFFQVADEPTAEQAGGEASLGDGSAAPSPAATVERPAQSQVSVCPKASGAGQR